MIETKRKQKNELKDRCSIFLLPMFLFLLILNLPLYADELKPLSKPEKTFLIHQLRFFEEEIENYDDHSAETELRKADLEIEQLLQVERIQEKMRMFEALRNQKRINTPSSNFPSQRDKVKSVRYIY